MIEDQFGNCPECGGNDGYRNVYKQHFFYCNEHRTVWPAGINLFSSWRDESEGTWRENYDHLKDYRIVDPQANGETLGEAFSYGTLVPPK